MAAMNRLARRCSGLRRSGSGGAGVGGDGRSRSGGSARDGVAHKDARDRRARGVGAHGVPNGVDAPDATLSLGGGVATALHGDGDGAGFHEGEGGMLCASGGAGE